MTEAPCKQQLMLLSFNYQRKPGVVNRYRKSIDIIDISRFNTSIVFDFYRKLILIEVTTFFYRFLSIDLGNWYSSMIDIDYYWLLSIIWFIDLLRLD